MPAGRTSATSAAPCRSPIAWHAAGWRSSAALLLAALLVWLVRRWRRRRPVPHPAAADGGRRRARAPRGGAHPDRSGARPRVRHRRLRRRPHLHRGRASTARAAHRTTEEFLRDLVRRRRRRAGRASRRSSTTSSAHCDLAKFARAAAHARRDEGDARQRLHASCARTGPASEPRRDHALRQPELLWLLLLLSADRGAAARPRRPGRGARASRRRRGSPRARARRGARRAPASRRFAGSLVARRCSIVALARPQQVLGTADVEASGIDIVLAIDVSGSMRGARLQARGQAGEPDSTSSSRWSTSSSTARPNDRIGIVAFAGRPYLVSPLTLDHDWLRAEPRARAHRPGRGRHRHRLRRSPPASIACATRPPSRRS